MARHNILNLICVIFVFMNLMQAKIVVNNISSNCGLTNSPKIVGGTEAAINEFPWMAFILTMSSNNTFMCGGSLVTNRHLITAAHCMKRVKVDDIRVFFGGLSPLNSDTVGMKALALKIHPQYNKTTFFDYDIAIISLSQSIKFTSKLLPICLPPTNLNYEGVTGTVLGWGRLTPSSHASAGTLMKANVPIINNTVCSKIYNSASITITPRMLCAGKNGSDICMGDSGGPLMLFINGRYHIIGIASFGDDSSCGSAGIPGSYARVETFTKFIANTIFEDNILNIMKNFHNLFYKS